MCSSRRFFLYVTSLFFSFLHCIVCSIQPNLTQSFIQKAYQEANCNVAYKGKSSWNEDSWKGNGTPVASQMLLEHAHCADISKRGDCVMPTLNSSTIKMDTKKTQECRDSASETLRDSIRRNDETKKLTPQLQSFHRVLQEVYADTYEEAYVAVPLPYVPYDITPDDTPTASHKLSVPRITESPWTPHTSLSQHRNVSFVRQPSTTIVKPGRSNVPYATTEVAPTVSTRNASLGYSAAGRQHIPARREPLERPHDVVSSNTQDSQEADEFLEDTGDVGVFFFFNETVAEDAPSLTSQLEQFQWTPTMSASAHTTVNQASPRNIAGDTMSSTNSRTTVSRAAPFLTAHEKDVRITPSSNTHPDAPVKKKNTTQSRPSLTKRRKRPNAPDMMNHARPAEDFTDPGTAHLSRLDDVNQVPWGLSEEDPSDSVEIVGNHKTTVRLNDLMQSVEKMVLDILSRNEDREGNTQATKVVSTEHPIDLSRSRLREDDFQSLGGQSSHNKSDRKRFVTPNGNPLMHHREKPLSQVVDPRVHESPNPRHFEPLVATSPLASTPRTDTYSEFSDQGDILSGSVTENIELHSRERVSYDASPVSTLYPEELMSQNFGEDTREPVERGLDPSFDDTTHAVQHTYETSRETGVVNPITLPIAPTPPLTPLREKHPRFPSCIRLSVRDACKAVKEYGLYDSAHVCCTVTNGTWSHPNIWDCGRSPSPQDVAVVLHQVELFDGTTVSSDIVLHGLYVLSTRSQQASLKAGLPFWEICKTHLMSYARNPKYQPQKYRFPWTVFNETLNREFSDYFSHMRSIQDICVEFLGSYAVHYYQSATISLRGNSLFCDAAEQIRMHDRSTNLRGSTQWDPSDASSYCIQPSPSRFSHGVPPSLRLPDAKQSTELGPPHVIVGEKSALLLFNNISMSIYDEGFLQNNGTLFVGPYFKPDCPHTAFRSYEYLKDCLRPSLSVGEGTSLIALRPIRVATLELLSEHSSKSYTKPVFKRKTWWAGTIGYPSWLPNSDMSTLILDDGLHKLHRLGDSTLFVFKLVLLSNGDPTTRYGTWHYSTVRCGWREGVSHGLLELQLPGCASTSILYVNDVLDPNPFQTQLVFNNFEVKFSRYFEDKVEVLGDISIIADSISIDRPVVRFLNVLSRKLMSVISLLRFICTHFCDVNNQIFYPSGDQRIQIVANA